MATLNTTATANKYSTGSNVYTDTGASNKLPFGVSDNDTYHAFLRFDLDSILSKANITRAELHVYRADGYSNHATSLRLVTNITGGGNNGFTTVGTTVDTFTFTTGTGWKTISVTPSIINALASDSANRWLMLYAGGGGNTYSEMNSIDETSPSDLRPYLVLTYTMPLQVMVNGAWHYTNAAKVLVNGAWRNVVGVEVLVNGAWREVM